MPLATACHLVSHLRFEILVFQLQFRHLRLEARVDPLKVADARLPPLGDALELRLVDLKAVRANGE